MSSHRETACRRSWIFWAFLFALVLFALLAAAPEAMARDVAPGDPNLLYVGRWDKSDATVYRGHWIAPYARTRFTGTSVAIRLASEAQFVVSIDGEPFRALRGIQGTTRLHTTPLAPGSHTLTVGSSGGGVFGFQGLAIDADGRTEPPVQRPLIECVGDSITCGTTGHLQAAGNYNFLTAEALQCDHTQISFPARALTSGFGCAKEDKVGLDAQYFQLNGFYDVPAISWNFSYTPEMVIINLGQNDSCGGEPLGTFTHSYFEFIAKLRGRYPQAQIVALRPFGGAFEAGVREAVADASRNGDERIHFVDTSGWLKPSDFADGVHPNDAGNIKLAARLVPILKPWLGLLGKTDWSAPAAVGDPSHPESLAGEIENAYAAGAHHIVIKPGTYDLPRTGHPAIALDQWRNAVISAYDVKLNLADPTPREELFMLRSCSNVTIEGVSMIQSRMTAYQGKVSEVEKDVGGKVFLKWIPSAGYPVPGEEMRKIWLNVIDGQTRLFKLNVDDFGNAGLKSLGGGAYRVSLNATKVNIEAGDWLIARCDDPPRKVFLDASHDCTIRDATLMRNGFAPIFENGGGGNHVIHCTWTAGPRPPGASEDPLVTNAADGIHSAAATLGMDIEKCVFEGIFLDDCIAIHGQYQDVVAVDGGSVVVKNGSAQLTVGEPARFADSKKEFFATAELTALKDNYNGTSTLTLNKAMEIPLSSKASNPLHCGPGYRIIDCHLGNTRSRGILVKGDHGVIRDNVIEHCGMSAISVGPEFGEEEADYCRDVVIEGNTCRDNGRMNHHAAIWIHGEGAEENHEIRIVKNRLLGNHAGDILVEWAQGVVIGDDLFSAPSQWIDPAKPNWPVTIGYSTDVSIRGDKLTSSGAYAQPLVRLRDHVADVQQDAIAPDQSSRR